MHQPTLLLVAALSGCALFQPTQAAAEPAPAPQGALLGTFDSRLLALAYYRSSAFADRTGTARVAHARALDAGDPEAARRIEREMSDLQSQAHRQTFGQAPVPEILALVEDAIPALARSAGVQAVASRWDLVWQEPNAAFPDLSFLLAETFHPDAETLNMMKDIAGKSPLPPQELEGHAD
jgi:hypothetical protein